MSTPLKKSPEGSPARLKESPSSPFPSSSSSTSPLGHRKSVTKPMWAPLETDAPITLAARSEAEVHVCQLCGCWYETRKGLSSHARAHLRQIGIPDSDVKGGPIEYLYKIMKEQDLKPITRPEMEAISAHSSSRPSMKNPSSLSPPLGPTGSRSSTPIDLPPSKRARTSEDCRCVLCGEVFENRKGLASHSRSHLRDLGVTDLLGKASAINTLEELVSSGVLPGVNSFKTRNDSAGPLTSPARASSSSPAPPLSPSSGPAPSRSPFPSPALSASPTKCAQSPASVINRAPKAKKGFRFAVDPLHRKPKPEPVEIDVSELSPQGGSSSSLHAAPEHLIAASPTDVQAPPTVLCDFCGQLFDTRKALSCHVRAHLRQLGLTWSINTSPIDLLNQYLKYGEKVKTDSVFSPASVSGKAVTVAQGSKPCSSPVDYSLKEQPLSGKSGLSQNDTSCELCGFHFENRKALASHARAHLRQLGAHEWKMEGGTNSPIEFLSAWIRRDPSKVAEVTRRYRMGDLYIKKQAHRTSIPSPSLSTDSDSVPGSSLKPQWQQADHKASREDQSVTGGSSRSTQGHNRTKIARSDIDARSPRVSGHHSSKHLIPEREDSQQPRTGSIPAMLPKPPLTPLVKLVGKVYSLKCRFCEEVFEGPLSIQERWITHLQKHILDLGYKGKASPPAAPVAATVAAPALVDPVSV